MPRRRRKFSEANAMIRQAIPQSQPLRITAVARRVAERLNRLAADTNVIRRLQTLDDAALNDVGLRAQDVTDAAAALETRGIAAWRAIRGEPYASPGLTLRFLAANHPF
jgi:uncharacterized protein YjiS (DUF1127 family)